MKLEAPTNPDVIEALNRPANAPFIQLVIPPPTWWQRNRETVGFITLLLGFFLMKACAVNHWELLGNPQARHAAIQADKEGAEGEDPYEGIRR